MCSVSFVGDHYTQQYQGQIQGGGILQQQGNWPSNNTTLITLSPEVTKSEFDALKKEVETMKALLIKAKIYDEQTGQKDCEMEEKVALLKKVAELVGVNLDEVFGGNK